MNKKCQGCGVILQTKNTKEKGYIPAQKYEESPYCERCFKIMHYNEKLPITLENINEYILEEVNAHAQYAYFLIDFLNINEETTNTFKKIECPKTLLISKTDIIPKSIKEQNIIEWLRENYGITEQVIFQSTKKNTNTHSLIEQLEQKQVKECYILGYTNAGKSTLINKLCTINKIKDKELTTSLIPNTTIDFIKIKLSPSLTIIDSPGFTLTNTIYKEEEFSFLKKINPKKFLKPITYQTKEITSIIIEDKIRITPQNRNSLTFYMSNEVKIERVFKNNTQQIDLPKTTLKIKENSDVVIKSLGFVNIKEPCQLTIYIQNPSLIEVRPSMFGKKGESHAKNQSNE